MDTKEKYAVIFEKVEQTSEDKTIAVVASESEEVRQFIAILDEVSAEEEATTYSTSSPDFISQFSAVN